MNKGAADLGAKSLAADMRITLGVVSRRGVGKTRHIDTQELWLQSAIRNHDLEVQQVAGDENVADILTKNVEAEVLERHMAEMGFTRRNPAQRGSQNTSKEQISRLERCTDRAATAEAGAAAGAAATPTVKRSHGTGDDGPKEVNIVLSRLHAEQERRNDIPILH